MSIIPAVYKIYTHPQNTKIVYNDPHSNATVSFILVSQPYTLVSRLPICLFIAVTIFHSSCLEKSRYPVRINYVDFENSHDISFT